MSTDCGSFSGLKTLCVVTGASRGFGKTIALELSRVFAPGSSLVLIGRNGTKLQQTRDEILAIYSELNVHVEPLDVSSLDFGDFERTLKSVAESSVFDMAVMVHNAGTLTIGDCTLKANQLLDPHSIRSYFDTNLTSAMTMNALFLKYITQEKFKRRTIINISSLAADKPFKTWSLYCTGSDPCLK